MSLFSAANVGITSGSLCPDSSGGGIFSAASLTASQVKRTCEHGSSSGTIMTLSLSNDVPLGAQATSGRHRKAFSDTFTFVTAGLQLEDLHVEARSGLCGPSSHQRSGADASMEHAPGHPHAAAPIPRGQPMGMHAHGPRSAVAARQVVWAQHMRSHSHGPLDSMSKSALASIQDVDGDEVEALNPGGHAHDMVQPSGGHRAIHGHGGTLSQRAGTLQPQQQMQRSGNADGAESDVSGTLVVHGDGEEDSDALYGDDEHTGPSCYSMHMQMQGQQSHPALWGAGIGPISSQGMQDGMPGEQGATTAGGTHVRGRGSCDLSGPTSEDGTGMDTNCMQERPLSGQGGSATGTLGDGWHSGRQGRFEPSQAARLRRDSLKGTAAVHLARSERELMLLDPKRARRIIANRQSAAKSKERKQAHAETMGSTLSDISRQQDTVASHIQALQADSTVLTTYNASLVEEVTSLQSQLTALLHNNQRLATELHSKKQSLFPEMHPSTSLPMLQPVPLPQLRSLPTLLLPPPSADDGNADVNLNEQHPVLQQPPMQPPLNADGQMCMEGGIQAFGNTWPNADMDMLGPPTCSSAGGSAEGLHPVITTGPGFGLVPLPFAPREGGPGSCGWSGGVSHRLGPRGVGISRHRHTQSADVSSLSLAHFGMLGSPAV